MFLGSVESEVHTHADSYRHITDDAVADCKIYLSAEGVNFNECDVTSCMCTKCYLDFAKKRPKMYTEDILPYWLRNRIKAKKLNNNCNICSTSSASMRSPKDWLTGDNVQLVAQFFVLYPQPHSSNKFEIPPQTRLTNKTFLT